MCLNRKVLIGSAVVVLGILAFDRSLIWHILPLLLFAICPLSMVLMMRGMSKMGGMQGMNGNSQSCAIPSSSPGTTGMTSMDQGLTGMGMEHVGTVSPNQATMDELARLRSEVDQLRAERTTKTEREIGT